MIPTTPRWTKEEDALALELVAIGDTTSAMDGRIPGRTGKAIRTRAYYISLTPEERHEMNIRKGRGRRPTFQPKRWTSSAITPPPAVEADRARRMRAPRSLTAILMGDPISGQSALDRRQASQVQT